MRLKQAWLLGILLSLLSVAAMAAPSPVHTLEKVSNQLIAGLKRKGATLKNNRGYVFRLTRKTLLPHVDLNIMSRSVLGRGTWQKASNAQRSSFKREFTTMLIRTYASALASYTNETVQFYPIRGGFQGRSRVKVDSVINRQSGPAISVSYRLVLVGNHWKLYDLSVEGVSLIQSFRSQFANEISQGGMNNLLNRMKAHNQGRG